MKSQKTIELSVRNLKSIMWLDGFLILVFVVLMVMAVYMARTFGLELFEPENFLMLILTFGLFILPAVCLVLVGARRLRCKDQLDEYRRQVSKLIILRL